jgi:surface antigen
VIDARPNLTADSAPKASNAVAVSPAAAPFPTRRELRAQEQAAALASTRRGRRAAERAAESSSTASSGAASIGHRVEQPAGNVPSLASVRSAVAARNASVAVRSASAAATPPAFVKRSAPAKKPVRALVTMAIVGGLFASAGLPAYAMGVDANEAPASAAADTTSLSVSADTAALTTSRGSFTATSAGDLASLRANSVREANWEAYQKSGAIELGDDYPYYSELANVQGGGLSPLNYYYRECVDFVAWRLNRDAGSTEAPYKYDWSYLTPNGGDARAWKGNWEAHGWAVTNTPKVGWVAWFTFNHVAYVKQVNDDGTILIEEYNWMGQHKYGQRTIPVSDVAAFLSPPPA